MLLINFEIKCIKKYHQAKNSHRMGVDNILIILCLSDIRLETPKLHNTFTLVSEHHMKQLWSACPISLTMKCYENEEDGYGI